jgi:hypothetical protein
VRVPNDPGESTTGPFSELLRLQTEFYARLAEETVKYLRRLQGAATLAAPGTVLQPDGVRVLQASGAPGVTVEIKIEVENRQGVHSVVTPMLSPMVAASGVTWFPASEPEPALLLLAPKEVATLTIKIPVPTELPAAVYRGALLLQGFREGAIPVAISVAYANGNQPGARRVTREKRTKKKAAPSAKSGARKARRRA